MTTSTAIANANSSVNSKHQISIPFFNIPKTEEEFEALVNKTSFETTDKSTGDDNEAEDDDAAKRTVISESTDIFGFSDLGLDTASGDENEPPLTPSDSRATTPVGQSAEADHPFIKGMKSHTAEPEMPDLENKMLTENADVAYRSTKNSLVDLFFELEDVASGPVLRDLLERAWAHDNLATLKIIFNARSIHLGKSSRPTFYRCVGWLAQKHPKTLLMNLQWIVRPVIEKPKRKKVDESGVEALEEDTIDKENGLAHGYWKDLFNILALAANDELTVMCDPAKVLNIKNEEKKWKHNFDQASAKTARDARREERHKTVVEKFQNDAFYRLLHLRVASLCAKQLTADKALLKADDKKKLRQLSLAAKWAPTLGGMHDQHTLVTTTIAELLYPASNFDKSISTDRETYLKHAREDYRRLTLAPLRKALNVVERDITEKTYDQIKYERVPSMAMNRYSKLFAEKDFDRFDKYLENVAMGKSKISGAVLLPSTLVKAARPGSLRGYGMYRPSLRKKGGSGTSRLVAEKEAELQMKVLDGQWASLCKRIRDSGTLESSIAVCDVSGSMCGPLFKDGTCPMDSSIGLSLLLAETTAKPFGGHFITFDDHPEFLSVGGDEDKRSLAEKVSYIERAPWGGSTDFVSVFENLILPMAIKNKLEKDQMVKNLFVFSDMQFNSAGGGQCWTTSFERIKAQFAASGYDMPRIIFWNLAGGRAGYYDGDFGGDPTAPKPVTAEEEGTSLVSGYSQAMLKVFLDGGSFEDPEAEIEETEEVDSDGEVTVRVSKKQKMDPLSTVQKAISHDAYKMLKVVD